MIRASIIAAALLFSPANIVVPNAGDIVIQPKAIVQVVCLGIEKSGRPYIRSGTAFRIGSYFLSVNHVTTGPAKCFIGSTPISVSYASRSSDFSMLDADKGPYLPVDCGGFVKGHRYVALGYARGVDQITSVDLVATGDHLSDGQAVLSGIFAIVPGMSGGPILDADTGKVVGTNNVENFEEGMSGSVALKDTPVCKAAA